MYKELKGKWILWQYENDNTLWRKSYVQNVIFDLLELSDSTIFTQHPKIVDTIDIKIKYIGIQINFEDIEWEDNRTKLASCDFGQVQPYCPVSPTCNKCGHYKSKEDK